MNLIRTVFVKRTIFAAVSAGANVERIMGLPVEDLQDNVKKKKRNTWPIRI